MTIRENLETAALKSAVSTNTDLQAPNGPVPLPERAGRTLGYCARSECNALECHARLPMGLIDRTY
jgi:hypothetical protein